MDNIYCWCHDGIYTPYEVIEDEFNGVVYSGAKVVEGLPPRALPLIPVTIKDGIVGGDPVHMEWYAYCGP
jgi:Rieske Fe-S protein